MAPTAPPKAAKKLYIAGDKRRMFFDWIRNVGEKLT